ncbi:related to methenyltetrahydrofolate synthetase [Rhynchosporium agropyri]|uniref:5-formyltetrahydrofolate cyclo-ligase n=1 Tax=Rhynchosporium agropyri TaxID=914238 RepID=A0A1E1K6C4_9HELO|nr:related to methenyltetrahydrofolate synthetase [Rhynchosporium agropyri]
MCIGALIKGEIGKIEETRTRAMASSTALKAAKTELRTLMKQRLKKIQPESIESQSAAIFKTVTSFTPYQEAKRIGVYLSMPTGEIQTDAIVRHALQSGKQVFVPFLHKAQQAPPDTPRSVMEMVSLLSLSDYESLKQDSWGIPTISPETLEKREHILNQPGGMTGPLDLILMPGVAFDIDPEIGCIRRLGHGKGFYDYFLHRYMQNRGSQARETTSEDTDVLLCGLALQEQFLGIASVVPVGDHDTPLHSLVVGDGELLKGPSGK